VTQKLLATCLAAAALAGGAAGGLAAVDVNTPIVSSTFRPVVFAAPLPLDPAADVPTVDQLNAVLYGLADPAVSFSTKGYLVEGGIGRVEARAGDGLMKSAQAKGQLPLSFAVANITPAAAGAASAVVTATGPAMAPITQTIIFVNQGSWKLSRASAGLVLSMFNG